MEEEEENMESNGFRFDYPVQLCIRPIRSARSSASSSSPLPPIHLPSLASFLSVPLDHLSVTYSSPDNRTLLALLPSSFPPHKIQKLNGKKWNEGREIELKSLGKSVPVSNGSWDLAHVIHVPMLYNYVHAQQNQNKHITNHNKAKS